MAFDIEVTRGRTVVAVLEPGDSVVESLEAICVAKGIAQGYIPVFSGAFRTATVIGTRKPIADSDAPLPDSVTVRNAEGFGSGTIATTDGTLGIHLHIALGEKAAASSGTTGHLLDGVVQYPVEVVIEEVLAPLLARRPNADARGLATLVVDAS